MNVDPKTAEIYCNEAAVSIGLGDFGKAIQDCETALEYDPNCSKAYEQLGLAYGKEKNLAESYRFYKIALMLDPDNQQIKEAYRIAEEAFCEALTEENISLRECNPDSQNSFQDDGEKENEEKEME